MGDDPIYCQILDRQNTSKRVLHHNLGLPCLFRSSSCTPLLNGTKPSTYGVIMTQACGTITDFSLQQSNRLCQSQLFERQAEEMRVSVKRQHSRKSPCTGIPWSRV